VLVGRVARGASGDGGTDEEPGAPKFETKYKVKDWPAYEAALRRRGDVTVWFDEAAIDAWNAGRRSPGPRPTKP